MKVIIVKDYSEKEYVNAVYTHPDDMQWTTARGHIETAIGKAWKGNDDWDFDEIDADLTELGILRVHEWHTMDDGGPRSKQS